MFSQRSAGQIQYHRLGSQTTGVLRRERRGGNGVKEKVKTVFLVFEGGQSDSGESVLLCQCPLQRTPCCNGNLTRQRTKTQCQCPGAPAISQNAAAAAVQAASTLKDALDNGSFRGQHGIVSRYAL